MNKDKTRYILTLTTDQAKMISSACEFYARMRCGQWQELIPMCFDWDGDVNEFCEMRDIAEEKLIQARKAVFPELSESFGHSYGVGKFEDSDFAWDIHQVIRNKIAWHEHPEGGTTVDFQPPMSYSGKSLIKCEVKEGTNNV